ncbi:Nop8p NDAI_0G03720 [Naumovozyma dairenensis CBS 421]|uniref:RRM domain-containing protein n=1 Tax=Naumovozyma dairenensis (strain ATCC 10597 / BCRC 20456 / CBS 421 / NBRC 0211 / NRRL Y-12639) TaxID=1071378 RepID=G0WED8_NAUDC|nr:hypothetical protein NDAI_0G03720 [Naumovozyma dairenensis CBS 421]CCD26149.2 hypothetical protein NDAI_0G03720 [Naumovozyma dairenensis CBS 421]
MTNITTTPTPVRVFVGNIFHDFDSCLNDLYKRFGTFGSCLDPHFEKHGTFAYLNMSFDPTKNDKGFEFLKRSLNNVKFKGNVLKIDMAKPNWEETWKLRHESDIKENVKKEKFNAKQDWKHYKKLENISLSLKDHQELMKGRMRKTPRKKSELRKITFRINVNGSLKVYKCYKTKLWGYERNKDLRDLVVKFVGNKWKNGFDHIVDKLDYSRSNKNFQSRVIEFKTKSNTGSISLGMENDSGDEDMSEEEKEKNNEVLSKVLQDFDFDKPMKISLDDDDVDDEDEEMRGQQNKNYDTNYNNREIREDRDVQQRHTQVETESITENEGEEEGEQEEEEEFIPTFGATTTSVEQPASVVEGTISNTKTLRNLFAPDESQSTTSFKLIEENDEDIDHERDEEMKRKQQQERDEYMATHVPVVDTPINTNELKENKNFLFFPHHDSPFLVGQTQLTKIIANSIPSEKVGEDNKDTINNGNNNNNPLYNWEDEFWGNRGVWMKEMKNRKRDALRQLRKRRNHNNDRQGNGLLI